MTFEEEKEYNNAKMDILKAMRSFQKLKPPYKEQLAKELVGTEALASAWQFFQNMNNNQR